MLEKGKFTEIDEEFVCENCGKKVKNWDILAEIIVHIVYILSMLTKIPGDREELCHGILEPIGLEINSKKGYVMYFVVKMWSYKKK